MAEKLTPNGLVVGLIPDEAESQTETPAPEVAKTSGRGGRKPRSEKAE
jgi:hypothetical protein